MEYTENKTSDISLSHMLCVGPLAMNSKKRVGRLMDVELPLDEYEFDALYFMAKREGELLPFELLYTSVWGARDGSFDRETAQGVLENLIRKVRDAAEGFIVIGYKPESGYCFWTRWGHEWFAPNNIKGDIKK